MRDEGRDVQLMQHRAKLLRFGPAVDEDEPLFTAMKPRDHDCGVLKRPDVIEHDIRLTPGFFVWPEHDTGRPVPPHEPASHSSNASGLPTVADSPIR